MLPSSRSLRAVAWILTLFLLLPGCVVSSSATTTPGATSTPNEATPSAPSLAPTPKPNKGGTLVVALPVEPDILNFSLTDDASTLDALSALDSRMIRITANGQFEPQLLTEVPTSANGGISPDGLTWVLHFRAKVNWSDDHPLDGRDLLFTWKTITNPSYPAVSRDGWDDISSIALSPDDLTATLSLSRPSGQLINTILAGGSESASGFLLPEHLFNDMPAAEIARSSYGDTGHISSGPFTIVKWSQGDELVMQRNDRFFGDHALLDRIVLRFDSDTRNVMTNLSTGELDLGVDLSEASVVDLRQIPSINAEITPEAGSVEMIYLNLNDPNDLAQANPLLSDSDVRQALILGFNRQMIVGEFLLGQSNVAITPLDHTQWADPTLKPYPYDPAKAEQVLDSGGWVRQSDGVRARDGVRLTFRLTVVQGDEPQAILEQRIAKAFVTDMAAIGIQVQTTMVTAQQLHANAESGGIIANRSFDAVESDGDQRSGVAEFDSRYHSANIPTVQNPAGGNITGYRSASVDSALNHLNQTVDPRVQAQFLDTAQRAIYDDLPAIPVYDHFEVDASRSYVSGLSAGPISGLWWNTEQWWINKDQASP